MVAGALVGVHRRPERPRPAHPAQPRHITRRQTGGGAHIHRTTKTRYSYVLKERPLYFHSASQEIFPQKRILIALNCP